MDVSCAADNRWVCYLLVADDGSDRTYVGATINPDRRLRQHNGEISGGAKATAGRHWRRVCYVRGFTDGRAALQFEWRWKYFSRSEKGRALERRMNALRRLLVDDRWVGKCLEIVSDDSGIINIPPVI